MLSPFSDMKNNFESELILSCLFFLFFLSFFFFFFFKKKKKIKKKGERWRHFYSINITRMVGLTEPRIEIQAS